MGFNLKKIVATVKAAALTQAQKDAGAAQLAADLGKGPALKGWVWTFSGDGTIKDAAHLTTRTLPAESKAFGKVVTKQVASVVKAVVLTPTIAAVSLVAPKTAAAINDKQNVLGGKEFEIAKAGAKVGAAVAGGVLIAGLAAGTGAGATAAKAALDAKEKADEAIDTAKAAMPKPLIAMAKPAPQIIDAIFKEPAASVQPPLARPAAEAMDPAGATPAGTPGTVPAGTPRELDFLEKIFAAIATALNIG